jgi:hypothetical protein
MLMVNSSSCTSTRFAPVAGSCWAGAQAARAITTAAKINSQTPNFRVTFLLIRRFSFQDLPSNPG